MSGVSCVLTLSSPSPFFCIHAYTRPGRPQHAPVGWEPDNDGFRGYIFATDDNSTVVLSIKGTTAQWVDKGPTRERDKINDNLLFSCCCARIGWSWKTVCDCYRGGWKCNQDCLEDALVEESLFYPVGTVCCIIFLNCPVLMSVFVFSESL